MASDVQLAARLDAYRRGRAVRVASHRRLAIHGDAMVLAPIGMAGEDTTVHAIAYGRIGQSPRVLSVPDPRIRDDQYAMLERLADEVEVYFAACRVAGTYPQVWVSSGAAADYLDVLADRFRFVRDNSKITRMGELLTYLALRYPVAGQQALQTATGALASHYATGQQPGEDEHLGALLTWVQPPAGADVLAAVALAEQEPMGVHTDPEFDRDFLAPLVGDYNAARKRGASKKRLERIGLLVLQAIDPVARRIYLATQKAIAILRALRLPPLPDLPDLEQREAEEFGFYMARRDAGTRIPLRDGPRAGAFNLAARLDAVQNAEAALTLGDTVSLAEAELRGDVLVGVVENGRTIKEAPRRFVMVFDIVSSQRIHRVRRGDEMVFLGDPRLRIVVTAVQRGGRITRVSVRIVHGSRAVGLPGDNLTVRFVPGVPDWDSLLRLRMQLTERLAVSPWTHDPNASPPAPVPRARRPKDPVEALAKLL